MIRTTLPVEAKAVQTNGVMTLVLPEISKKKMKMRKENNKIRLVLTFSHIELEDLFVVG